MKKFMDKDFLLQGKTAQKLYHGYAKDLPIIDYHCHISPEDIARDRVFDNITRIWLEGDHYKWRAMRINGIDEKYITGEAGDREKFSKWSETVPYCIGNPLFHWTHLELKRYFNIDCILSQDTADSVWEIANDKIAREDFSTKNLIKNSNVEIICTTDNPTDSLEYHSEINADKSFGVKVIPTMRNDMCINIGNPAYAQWVKELEKVSGTTITDLDSLKEAIIGRIDHFDNIGCRISDHALESVDFYSADEKDINRIYKKVREGGSPDCGEKGKYMSHMMVFLGREYAKRGWAMQLHIGALRNNNSRMAAFLGPDTGFDSIGDSLFASGLASLLDALDSTDELPRTVLFCLNPRDNEVLGTLIGCFTQKGIKSKVQFGPGWWFNDQKDGMERHMTALANLSLLSSFIGMTTDSRSFLSYPRHEYFRRILCNILGIWVHNGEVPDDMDMLGEMVKNICYSNAREFFDL